MPARTPPQPDDTTLHELPMFEWRPCPLHPVLAVSVLVVPDAKPWCVGDGDEIRGHWAEVAA